MNKPIFLGAIFIMTFVSCWNNRWEYACRYPSHYRANAVLFDHKMGLLAGSFLDLAGLDAEEIAANRWLLSKAVILKTELNNCDQWISTYLGNGEILQMVRVDNLTILSLGREYDLVGKQNAYLLISDNKGQDWKTLPEPPDLFNGMGNYKNEIVYAWTDDSVFISKNLGSSWMLIAKDLPINPNQAKPIVGNKGKLWIPTNSSIACLSSNGNKQTESIGKNMSVDCFFQSPDGSFWILGRSNEDFGKKVFLVNKNKNKHRVVSVLPYFLPLDLWVADNTIRIWCSEIENQPPTKLLMTSTDNGISWSTKKPKDSYANGPIFFEERKFIWNVATKGRIQRLTLP